jgi:NAD(P)-dependent dehydrogenase (short-subunit alcohol dehydrogenase family)
VESGEAARPFEPEEWSTCLRVLESLCQAPESAPDRQRIERLVARIYKKARKDRRKASAVLRRDHDRLLVEQTSLVRASPIPGHGPVSQAQDPPQSGLLRSRSRRCYICHCTYREVHFHYHLLCAQCARLNFAKRSQQADLCGRRAIVTGGRIKIGHQVALALLRNGAEVLVTTRFPRDAALRFASQTDFPEWKERLRIQPLDLRRLPEVVAFTERLVSDLPSLEILVNNAAQTVRRPGDFYARPAALEALPVDDLPANLRALTGVISSDGLASRSIRLALECGGRPIEDPHAPLQAWYDRHGEPLDRREDSSWTARLGDVGLVESVEVLLVNATAPFLLTGRLKPLFLRSPFPDRYVVNVSGLDGQFGRSRKSERHPHVNMSKAALNMMTRTSAADYARDGIFMNSVDTGWITHEGSYSTRVRLRAQGFVPPLDEVDGAARVCDPIMRGVRGERDWGKFFKDYRPTAW